MLLKVFRKFRHFFPIKQLVKVLLGKGCNIHRSSAVLLPTYFNRCKIPVRYVPCGHFLIHVVNCPFDLCCYPYICHQWKNLLEHYLFQRKSRVGLRIRTAFTLLFSNGCKCIFWYCILAWAYSSEVSAIHSTHLYLAAVLLHLFWCTRWMLFFVCWM